jgi:uncharacterized protein
VTAPVVWVTGAGGLVGRALAARRAIVPVPRRQPDTTGPWWEPMAGRVHDDGSVVAAVVHLAGENVAGKRWDDAHKRAIRDSRVLGSKTLVDWMGARTQRPSVLVAASATGFYGHRGDIELDEEAGVGTGFLAEVTEAWESELTAAEAAGVRVVRLRLGVVLAAGGGALSKMLPAFRAGVGGPIGSGRQWFPWVHLDDVVGVVDWALTNPHAQGAYNVVSPGIVRQREFAKTLGQVLRRPAFVPAPAAALKLLFGEMAEEALLSSTRAIPRRLEHDGYAFRHIALEPALRDATARK